MPVHYHSENTRFPRGSGAVGLQWPQLQATAAVHLIDSQRFYLEDHRRTYDAISPGIRTSDYVPEFSVSNAIRHWSMQRLGSTAVHSSIFYGYESWFTSIGRSNALHVYGSGHITGLGQ